MIFTISRASHPYKSRKAPCAEAYKGEHEYPNYKGERVKSIGWLINIESMEELQSFIKKYGAIIIEHEPDGLPSLTIYDAYVE